MSDENQPSTPPPPPEASGPSGAGETPPPPPGGGTAGAGAPPPPSGGAGGPGDPADQNRQIMLVLSYLLILSLIPYLTERDDPEVKWHARHGLVLMAAEILLGIVLFILINIPVIGCAFAVAAFLIYAGLFVFHIVCIVKALKGERVIVPYVSQYADQIP